MQQTFRLFQACRITLFTRPNCGLCIKAKDVLSQVQKSRPFILEEINIVQPGQQAWRDLYDFDVPVIHISRTELGPEDPAKASKAPKLMHRFTNDEVTSKMDSVESH